MASLILVVDDDSLVAQALCRRLQDWGHSILVAGGGKEVMRAVHERHPDLVLLDMYLDGEDGIWVLRELKRLDDSPPVVAMTGARAGDSTLQAARLLGAAALLKKPFGSGELLRAVAKALPSGE